MTRVHIHDIDSAPEGSRDALKVLEEKFGTTLNIFGAMANAPAVLNADTVRTILTNYFNHFVNTEQDVPKAPAL